MKKLSKKSLSLIVFLIVIGQIVFALYSGKYTEPYFESQVFATTGIQFDGSDLHKLNEGAHYFGQTMIGWTKFPNFRADLVESVGLPDDTDLNMHMQERQNVILTLQTDTPISFEDLVSTKEYFQNEIDEYNENTNTQFVLTNVDYSQAEISRTYGFGALTTLIISVVIGIGLLFIRKELFPPKLKL